MANTSISKAVNAVSNPAPVIPFEQAIETAMLSVKTSIPNHIDFNVALQMFKNLRSKNPALANCTKESLIGAMLTASELGLMPVNQQVYFIPYFNNKKNVMECQLQIGYQGMVDLFYRSDRAISVDAKAVREKDTFEYDDGLNPTLTYKPCLKGLPGETYGYYAVAKLKDEGIKIVYMTKDEVMIHAKQFCKAIDKNGNFTGPWGTNFDEMAKKTVLKKLFKVLPKSINLEKALEVDEGVKEYRPGVKTMFACLPKLTCIMRKMWLKPIIRWLNPKQRPNLPKIPRRKPQERLKLPNPIKPYACRKSGCKWQGSGKNRHRRTVIRHQFFKG
jgi:recombination protein RecT